MQIRVNKDRSIHIRIVICLIDSLPSTLVVSWYVCLCALVSSPHVAVVYPASALALRLLVTPTSAFLFLHEVLYESLDQLLVAADWWLCWRVSLYILQASTCPVRASSYESYRLVLTDSGDALTCCIAQFTHSWQSSSRDTRQLQVSESVCSAELEAVFGIYDRTTTVLGMHCNPHAQCF